MGNEVKLKGQADLEDIYKSLKKLTDGMEESMRTTETLGRKTQDGLERTAKKTENTIKQSGSLLRRMAGQLTSDFKALFAMNAIQGALKLSSQFSGAIKESIMLSDTIRRLGGSFGVASSDFGKFQAKLAKGLGDIGASSEAAAEAIQGLAGFGVKGMDSAGALATGAVTLAGMSGEKGNERGIARQLASALQASGQDVNNAKAQQDLIGEVTAATQATGKQASEILGAMEQISSSMDQQLRKTVGPQAMAQMAVMATTVGPAATKALQEYLSKGQIQRMPLEAQGFKVFGDQGQVDMKELQRFIQTTQSRGMSPRESLQTAGFSEEAAEGLVRLGEKADLVSENMKKLDGATRDNVDAFRKSMGLMDSFKGSINTIKGRFEELTSGLTKNITDLLSAQVGHTAGAGAVVAGGATLAAILAGGGLRGVAGMVTGRLSSKAQEAVTGEKVQDVYVTNAAEIGGAAAGLGGASKLGGMLGKGMGVAGAGAIGYMAGEQIVNPLLDKFQGTTDEGFQGNPVERLFFKLDQLFGGAASGQFKKNMVDVNIVTTEPNLKPIVKPSRGRSH